MAGTRLILANYLRTMGLTPLEIRTIISTLIEQPEYPNLPLLHVCFSDLGLKLQAIDVAMGDLVASNTPVLSSLNAGESYVIVLGVKSLQVYFLDAGGNLNAEAVEKFEAGWDKRIYLISASVSLENLRSVLQSRLTGHQFVPNNRPSLDEIRKASLSNEPYIYRVCRLFSIYLTYWLVRLRIHPNVITASWLIPIVCAGTCFSRGFTLVDRWMAVAFILLGLTLDCCDGETARLTGKNSYLGGYLDNLIHWVSSPVLIIGIICGELRTEFSLPVAIGSMLCVAAGTTYNYVVKQLNTWRQQGNPYAQFNPLFSILFYLYPLDINIFLIGAIFNKVPEALRAWLYLSTALMVLLLTSFIRQEIKHARKI